MQRTRRLASMTVVASLALAGLSACRAGTDVAASVGDARITEERVQAVLDDARNALGENAANLPITREDVVNVLVSRDLIDRVAARHNVRLPASPSYDQFAALVRLPATTEYVRLYTEYSTLQYDVEQSMTSTTPLSDDDLKDVFDRLTANGGIEPGTTFDTFRTSVPPEALTELQAAVALRDEVHEVADPLNVSVHPRYQPLELGVYGVRNQKTNAIYQLVAAEVGTDVTVPVSDIS
ncbi:hypothetical protein [Actinoplanes regularis]|uniref:hypothetical protein n=1 Tax=Actinoplanes regularis TaxID=52697 RepID=UPI0025540D7B|nr:hypothetical protein [Actinoplanes regularis]